MSTTLTLIDSGDVMKYLERGERIIARLLPRPVPFYCADDPAAPAETLREFRRLTDNLCRLDEWSNQLPHGAGAHSRSHLVNGGWIGGRWTIFEPGAGAPIAAHWAYLENRLVYAAEHAADSVGDPEDAARWMREARYYLKRMRVLADRGEEFSSVLTLDELATDLHAHGIRLE